MPGGDGTGPAGMGPMTGRAAGYCAGYAAPGYMNPAGGRGFGAYGRGRGGGRGRRNWFGATGMPGWQRAAVGMPAYGVPFGQAPVGPAPTPQQELDALKNQAQYFQDAMADIQQRIEQLEAEASGE